MVVDGELPVIKANHATVSTTDVTKYCATTTFNIVDSNIATVEVNGTEVTLDGDNAFTITGIGINFTSNHSNLIGKLFSITS